MKARAVAPMLLALAGCAAQPPADEAPHPGPLAAYAADPFVPVNLYFNANEHLAGPRAALVEHAARRLADSGAFVRIDRGVQRWPITIQAAYRLAGEPAAGRRLLGALSLGLVPVHVPQTHTLAVEIFEEPERVAALALQASARNRVSLYDLGDPLRDERAAIDALLEQMLADIARRRLVPRWEAFKPAPPKKKRKPEGRAT